MNDLWKIRKCTSCFFQVNNKCKESPPIAVGLYDGDKPQYPFVLYKQACSKYKYDKESKV